MSEPRWPNEEEAKQFFDWYETASKTLEAMSDKLQSIRFTSLLDLPSEPDDPLLCESMRAFLESL